MTITRVSTFSFFREKIFSVQKEVRKRGDPSRIGVKGSHLSNKSYEEKDAGDKITRDVYELRWMYVVLQSVPGYYWGGVQR